MLAGAGESFEPADILKGRVTPVFFGSGITNFGVQPLLDYFVKYGATPQPRRSSTPES